MLLNKKIVLFLIFLLSSCSMDVIKRNERGKRPRTAPRQFFNGVKKKVVLLTFFNESPYGGQDLGITATEELRKEMIRSGQYVIEPKLKSLFGSSKEIYSGGGVKLVQMTRKAKSSGINFVVFGRIIDARIREKTDEIGVVRETKSYSEAKVELRVFDINAGKEIFTETIPAYADDNSFKFFISDRESKLEYRRNLLRYVVKIAVRKAVPRLLKVYEKLDWVGRVAKIIGTKIYINAGRRSGINIGDILKVLTEGVEIFDPETGAMIGTSKGELKGTVEIIDFVGQDASVAILHSGGSVHEGDFVQLY